MTRSSRGPAAMLGRIRMCASRDIAYGQSSYVAVPGISRFERRM